MDLFYKRLVVVLGFVIFGSVLVLHTARADEVADRIVAVVNGEIITLFDLNQQLKGYTQQFEGRAMTLAEKKALAALRKKTLTQMINDILLRNEAQRLGMVISDVEVKNQVEAFKKQHGLTEKQFLDQLTLQGMTRKDYEKKVREDIMCQRLIGAMVRRKVVVTEDEMKAYYASHKGDFSREKKLDLALILVDAGFDINALRAKILSGTIRFAEAAIQYSQGPGAKQGGELGSIRWVDLGDAWKRALQGLGKGDVSLPFELSGKKALLYIKEYVSGEAVPYNEVKNTIRDILYRPRIEKRYEDYIHTLRDKAMIDIRL